MGRQPFRQMKSDGTMKVAADAGGGGGGFDPTLGIKRSGYDSTTSRIDLHFIPTSGTNSFSRNEPFYHAKKQYFVPLWSGVGGTLDKIKLISGNDTHNGFLWNPSVGTSNSFHVAVYSSNADEGWPESKLTAEYHFAPASTGGTNTWDVQDSAGDRISLSADTWYWVSFLGGSSTSGGNIDMATFNSYRVMSLQIPGNAAHANQCYWSPTVTSMASSFTISGSNRFVANQTNNTPRIFFSYLPDSTTKRWGA